MEEDLGQQEKEQLNTFKEIWKKEINGVTMRQAERMAL